MLRNKLTELKKNEELKKSIISSMGVSYAHLVKFLGFVANDHGYSIKSADLIDKVTQISANITIIDSKIEHKENDIVNIIDSNADIQTQMGQLNSNLNDIQLFNQDLYSSITLMRQYIENLKHRKSALCASSTTKFDLFKLRERVNSCLKTKNNLKATNKLLGSRNRLMKKQLISVQRQRTAYYDNCLKQCNSVPSKDARNCVLYAMKGKLYRYAGLVNLLDCCTTIIQLHGKCLKSITLIKSLYYTFIYQ